MSFPEGLDPNLLVAQYGDPESWCGVSASGAGATIECPTRLALPESRTKSDAADRGTELHAFARVVTINPAARDAALAAVPEKWRHTAKGMDLEEALRGLQVKGCERAYAVNVKERKVRFIGENIERGYAEELARQGKPPLGRYEIPFTIDVEASYEDVPVELDYKSGQSIGDPAEHWQRRICAVGLMLAYDAATCISRVAYIWDDGRIVHDGHEFTALDVDDYCDTLVKMIDAVWTARLLLANGIMPPVFPSDSACAYCPGMMSCPYWMNTARSMLGKLQAVTEGPDLTAVSLDELGKVWTMAKQVEKLLEPLFKGMKTIAADKPLPIDDKYEVRPLAKSRSYFDEAKARGLIMQLMGRAGSSPEEIEAALKKLQGKTEYPEYRRVKRVLPVAP